MHLRVVKPNEYHYLNRAIKRKPQFRRRPQGLSRVVIFLKLYFNQSCIHGFAYLAKSGLLLLEKFLWLILIVICIIMCIVVGLQSVNRYKTSSTVISLERDFYFWRTSLPSITVCPWKRLNQELFDDYCSSHKVEDKEKANLHNFLESLANSSFGNINKIPELATVASTLERLDIQPADYLKLIYNLTVDYALLPDENLRLTTDEGSYYIAVQQVLTEGGLCYTTNNYLDAKFNARYLIFGEYPEVREKLTPVMRGTYYDKAVRYTFKGPLVWRGVSVFLHSAFDNMKFDRTFVSSNEAIYYYAYSSEMTTDDDLQAQTSVSQRRCRFHDESNLEHYPVYTRTLCMQECRLNLILKKCQCIPYFYPNRIPKPKPVCNIQQMKECVFVHRPYFLNVFGEQQQRLHPCNCLQNCKESYVVFKSAHIIYNTKILYNGYTVIVEVNSWPRNRLRRQHIYTFTDLLVSIGGTAGLFLGFSVLSAVEFLYYFSLRLFYYIRGYNA